MQDNKAFPLNSVLALYGNILRLVRDNSLKILQQRARTELRRNSFVLRVVRTWNTLPEIKVTSSTTNTFKNRLDKYWMIQTMLYEDYKATITESGED